MKYRFQIEDKYIVLYQTRMYYHAYEDFESHLVQELGLYIEEDSAV